MTTWAQLQASGSGRVAYALSIAGVRCYTTLSDWQADSDFPLADHKAWLDYESMPIIDERVNFLEGSLTVKGINLRLVASDTLIQELKDWRVRGYGRLTSTLTVAGTTASVDDTSWAPTSGQAWIGGEVVSYVGKTASTLTSLTRALLGTAALEHEYDPANRKRPVVADGPHTVVGRRAKIIAAVVDDDGTVGASQVLYRGRVTNSVQINPLSWTISLEHISNVLQQQIGQQMPNADIIQGYWYSGEAYPAFSTVNVQEINTTANTVVSEQITVVEGLYRDGDLASQFNARANALSGTLDLIPQVSFEGGKWHLVIRDTQIKTNLNIVVRRGDPLWALGFDAGSYVGGANTAEDWEAGSEPRLLAIDFEVTAEARPQVEVEDASELIEGLFVQIPGFGHMEIDSITNNVVDLLPTSYQHEETGRPVIAVDDDQESMILRHVFVFHASPIVEAIQRCLFLDSGQDEPASWCAQGSVADDWDWSELADALGSLPLIMGFWNDTVTKPQKVWDLFGPLMGALAIAPRITTDGKIGFERIRTPTDTIAETVDVDSSVWAAVEAKDATARLDDAPLVNVISIKHGWDYRRDDESAWHDPLEIIWDDGLNTLGKTQPMTYQIRGIQDTHTSHTDLETTFNALIGATHYGVFGRLATTIEIPCTWLAKQFKCGQIVKVTHDLAPDLTEGAYGVTDRLGIVMGIRRSLTGRQVDVLQIRIPPPTKAAGIAPCAYATSYIAGSKQLRFASTTLYSPTGVSDLSWFPAGDSVTFQEYDNSSGAFFGKTAIASVGSAAITLETDPFSGSFPALGVYMVFPRYGNGTEDQEAYAHIADAATIPTLGSSEDDADEWAI